MELGERVAELRNHGADVPRLAFSADRWLATTGAEARVFEMRRWTQVQVIEGPVQSLAFDTRSRLVTGSSNGEVALWSIPSGVRLRQLRASGEPVHAVAFSRDEALVAAGSDDGAAGVADRRRVAAEPAQSASWQNCRHRVRPERRVASGGERPHTSPQ